MTIYDKIARMKPEQEDHWIDVPQLSYWGERFFAEFAVAEAVAEASEQPILEETIDRLYDHFVAEHALTDSALQEAEQNLLCFSQRAKAYHMHCVAHAHIDMDWLWGFHETVDVVLNTFRTMLDLMDEYPEFTFSQSQCAVYRIAECYDPALFARMKQRVQEGRFEFAGSTFVELDHNMPNLESMARHILYTKQYLHEKFGIEFEDVNLDFHPDTFGHTCDLPEIFRAGGIKYFYHCRGLDGQYLYRWQAPSGAEVLALNEPLWYNDAILPMYISQVPRFCKRYGIHDMMKIYGVGDHGGGPTRQDLERIVDMQSWPVAPTIFFSTYRRYFDSIAPFKDSFPVVKGELGPIFTGCYTSQSPAKMANRIAEDRLFAAEALTAFAVRKTGMADFNRQFRTAWEKVLFNQFHDILPGSNVPESRDHAMGGFEEAMAGVMAASGASLRAFADSIDTSMFETPFDALTSRSEGGGVGLNMDQKSHFKLPGVERGRGRTRLLHFFNPTSYDRHQVLEAVVWDWPGDPKWIRAFDEEGNALRCTAKKQSGSEWGHSRTELLIEASVPAMGYATVRIEEGERSSFHFCELPPAPRAVYYEPLVMENDLVRVEFDRTDLSVKSYVNKRAGKELLGPEGGRFYLYREANKPRGGCGWVEGILMEPKDLHRDGTVVILTEVGGDALRKEFTYEIRWQKSTIAVRASLDADSPVVQLDVRCTWLEPADSVGTPRLSFRTNLGWKPEVFRSDVQIGLLDREPEALHDRISRDFFFAAGEGTGAALLTDSKYGYRGYGDTLEVTLLRASSGPDPLPELGVRTFRLGLSEAADDPRALKSLGSAFANPQLPYVSNRAHPGTLPLSGRFLELSGPAAITAVKLPEEGSGLIVRLASLGESGLVSLRAQGLTGAVMLDLAEQEMESCTVSDAAAMVHLGAGQIATLQLKF